MKCDKNEKKIIIKLNEHLETKNEDTDCFRFIEKGNDFKSSMGFRIYDQSNCNRGFFLKKNTKNQADFIFVQIFCVFFSFETWTHFWTIHTEMFVFYTSGL